MVMMGYASLLAMWVMRGVEITLRLFQNFVYDLPGLEC